MADPEHVAAAREGAEGIARWRKEHPGELLDLSGADLSALDLRKTKLTAAILIGAELIGTRLNDADLSLADLTGADFFNADLTGVDLYNANLTDAKFDRTDLHGAKLRNANLTDAALAHTNLYGANLRGATLTNAALVCVDLTDADLFAAMLNDATLDRVDLKKANCSAVDFRGARLDVLMEGMRAPYAIVDEATVILASCTIDRHTLFPAVPLASSRIAPSLLVGLQKNLRRFYWTRWGRGTKESPVSLRRKLTWWLLVKPFWWASDFGSSTSRIIKSFLGVSIVFALIYLAPWALGLQPFVTGLDEVDGVDLPAYMVVTRAVYLSVVTMTTLGFGDITANPESWWGHVYLTLQVVLGYMLLGALITRFAIMFQDVTCYEHRPPPESRPGDLIARLSNPHQEDADDPPS